MNDVEMLRLEVRALRARVKDLERNVRPILKLEGIDAELIGDQAVVQFLAEQRGHALTEITSASRARPLTAVRRAIARTLVRDLGWGPSRIARNFGRDVSSVKDWLRD